jgi:hypothetical protein
LRAIGNDFKFLRDLHKDYKQDIFGNKSDDEIKAFIYKHLGDASSNSKDFAFGCASTKCEYKGCFLSLSMPYSSKCYRVNCLLRWMWGRVI